MSDGTKAVARLYRATAWWSPRRGSPAGGLRRTDYRTTRQKQAA